MDEDNSQGDQEAREGVRLVGRREAEAAVQSGHAISRGSLNTVAFPDADDPIVVRSVIEPVVSGRPLQSALDLRDQAIQSAEMPEENMSFPDDEDELPEAETGSLPHWTEPATGEVPAAVLGTQDSEPELVTPDTSTWSLSSLGEASGLGESHIDFDAIDDETFLDDVRSAPAFATPQTPPPFEPFANDAADAVAKEAASVGSDTGTDGDSSSAGPKTGTRFRTSNPSEPVSAHTATATGSDRVELLKSSSVVQRVGTGVAFAVLAVLAFSGGPAWVLTLITAIVLLAAVEYFDAVRRVGYRPPTALGLIAVAGGVLGVYARGEAAIPLVLALCAFFTFLWFLFGVIEESPTSNTAVTLLGIVWIGIFGSYGALLLREPFHRGVAFILGGVLCVIAYDTAAYVGGTLIGTHLMSPRVSPGKTWEGLACATIASVLVGGLIVQAIHPWTFGSGLVLGVIVAIVAPIGDLAESMVKRDLGLKDMGRILPGHGGVLDRFDAMLFVLPATYYLVRMLNLA